MNYLCVFFYFFLAFFVFSLCFSRRKWKSEFQHVLFCVGMHICVPLQKRNATGAARRSTTQHDAARSRSTTQHDAARCSTTPPECRFQSGMLNVIGGTFFCVPECIFEGSTCFLVGFVCFFLSFLCVFIKKTWFFNRFICFVRFSLILIENCVFFFYVFCEFLLKKLDFSTDL